MEVKIKNMVCNRCIMAVKQIFQDAGIKVSKIRLGVVETYDEINDTILNKINENLKNVGFEIINDSGTRLIEQIKTTVIDYVYQNEWEEKRNLSDFIVDKIHLDYSYLSSLFSSVESVTIEKYFINLKIERVKKLILYDHKPLTEIAWELGFSSVAHLSGQFKKVTGFSTTYFKQLYNQPNHNSTQGL